MIYYLIVLIDGIVIDVCKYDEEDSRDSHIQYLKANPSFNKTWQVFNEVR